MLVRYCDMCRLRGRMREGALRYGLRQNRRRGYGGIDLCEPCWQEHAAHRMGVNDAGHAPEPYCAACRRYGARYFLTRQTRLSASRSITRGAGSLCLCEPCRQRGTQASPSLVDRRRRVA